RVVRVGGGGWAGRIALASTSRAAAIRRLGSGRWHRIHRLVYGIAVLAALHFFIQSKLNIYEPVLMAGFLMWLLAYRALYRRNGEVTPLHLLLFPRGPAAAAPIGAPAMPLFPRRRRGARLPR